MRFLLARLCPAVCGGIRRVPKPQQAGGGVDVRIEMRMQNAYRPEPPRSKPLMKLRHQHSGRFLYPLTRLPSYNRLLPVAHPVTSDTQRTTPRLLVCVWMDALENLLRPPRRPCPRQQPLPCRVRWLSEAGRAAALQTSPHLSPTGHLEAGGPKPALPWPRSTPPKTPFALGYCRSSTGCWRPLRERWFWKPFSAFREQCCSSNPFFSVSVMGAVVLPARYLQKLVGFASYSVAKEAHRVWVYGIG